tara:strand:- start:434 stop:700 length:267 start_codon:yes stop_codon:yes gene_type:complete
MGLIINELLTEGFEVLNEEEKTRKEAGRPSLEASIDVGINVILVQHSGFHGLFEDQANMSFAELIFIRWHKRQFGEESVETWHKLYRK